VRVGLVIYGSLESVSGGYLYDRKLVEFLSAQGDLVEVFSIPWRSYPAHLSDNLSQPLHQRLAGLSIDVLLQDELNHPSLTLLNQWLHHSQKESYPILSIVHHLRCSEARPGWQNWLYRQVERKYLRTVDGFIYNSQTTRRAVEGLLLGSPPGVVAYPAGDRFDPRITPGEIERRAHQPGPLHLLFVGNLLPRKGLHDLIRALARLPIGTAILDVVGRQDVDLAYTRSILRLVKRSGLQGAVNWHGSLMDAALAALLPTCQVMAVPSSYEGFGIAYLEGMGFGLPALACTNGGAREIVSDGFDGYLLEPGDVSALAERILSLAQDRARLAAMSLAARLRYQDWSTWTDMGMKTREFILQQVKCSRGFSRGCGLGY